MSIKSRMRSIITVGISIGMVTALWGADVTLIGEGVRATIVIPDKPENETRQGGEMLRDYVEKSTAIKLEVVPESRATGLKGSRIYVGRSIFVNDKVGKRLEPLSPDGFIIKTEDNYTILAGRTPFADKSAVAEFLRRTCGVEWYMPGELWEVVKTQAVLKASAGESVIEPAFKSRWHSGLNNRMNTGPNNVWAGCQRSSLRYDFMHSGPSLFPADKWTNQPDVYALIGGQRRVPGKGSLEGWQLCLTNPKVIDAYVRSADDVFRAGAGHLCMSVSPNDGNSFCECPNCAKFYSDKDSEKQRLTRLVYRMVNQVARRVREKYPDKLVGILSYGEYAEPAPDLKVEPNVAVCLVGCRLGPAGRLLDQSRLLAWEKAGVRHFGIWEWNDGLVYNVPAIYPRLLADSMRFVHAHGGESMYTESYPAWGLQGPFHWVVSRLSWDVNRNVGDLIGQYCRDLFGPAAASMQAYFERCETLWTNACVSLELGFGDPRQYEAYPLAARKELRSLLNRAEQESAADKIALERVRFFSKSFGYSERMCATYEAGVRALQAYETNNIPAALAALGLAGRPEDDPIRYMKEVLDPIPLALYMKSDDLNNWVLSGLRSATAVKIKIAGAIMTKAGQRVLSGGTISTGALAQALQASFAEYLPKESSPQIQAAVESVKEIAGKAVFAPELALAPTVDGDPTDAAWQGLAEYGGFYAYGGGVPAAYVTTFKMAYKGDRLYALVNCRQNMEKPKAGGTVRDSNVWLDDAVEIFLNRPDAKDPKDFFQAIVNINGVIFDQWQGNDKWNGDIQAAVKRFPDHWCLEVAIPLKAIGMSPAEVKGLKLNVVRDVWGPGPGKAAQINPWFPTTFGHADLNLRGWLFFVPK